MVEERDHIGIHESGWRVIPSGLADPASSLSFMKGGPRRGLPLSARQADLWTLVLESRDIPCRAWHGIKGWRIMVPEERFDEALDELRLFEEENRNWPPPPPETSPLVENTLATLSVLILLATFHNITLLDSLPFGNMRIDWLALGNADSAKILDGQWWRAVTALTLHADWLHLSGNLAIGGVFIVFLCRDFGSGLAWTLLLGSGVLGNLANAFFQPYNHNSIGASTLVFGAVGILAAINLVRHRRHTHKRRAMPIAAALGLLALLGTEGKNTDLGAHLFGFVFGTVLGLAAEYLVGRYGRPGRGLNALLAPACAGLMVSAWWAALAFAH
jgi:membrane associated rhomboid family serine protease